MTLLKWSEDVGILLRALLFVFGCLVLLFGLRYFIYPISMSRTGQGVEMGYDYETGITLTIPGLVMILISLVWSIANVQITSRVPSSPVPDGTTRCPHCGFEVEATTIPDVYGYTKGRTVSVCPHCGERI